MTQERADEDVELAKTNFDVLKGWAILTPTGPSGSRMPKCSKMPITAEMNVIAEK